MTKIIRAVAYPRYSSDNQREESLSAQMAAIEDYCKRKGYTLVNSYPDEAKSATTDKRPNFQRMIADSKKGLFDIVIVHKLDRFARDRYDSAFYKRELKKNGVRLESVLEQLDDSPESIILESVLEAMAEYYSKNLGREARKGMLENAKKALHAGGRPPYGYKVNPDTMKYEIDPAAAKVVRLYFEGIANGMSLQEIADQVNELGYRTQMGRRFTKNSFGGWASNRKYKGDYTWDVSAAKSEDGKRQGGKKKPVEQQIIIEGALPAIIDSELWERVNEIMKERKQKPGAMKAKISYLLSGKVVCGQCLRLYSGNSYRNSKSSQNTLLTYYKCSGKCGNTSVRKDELEKTVINNLIQTCFSKEAMDDTVIKVMELYQQKKSQGNEDIAPLKRELRCYC